MWQCHYCRSGLPTEVQEKNHLCPQCGSDLHACKNCTYYRETLSTRCEEPNSPWVADREAHNDCPFFEFRALSAPSHAQPTDEKATSEAEQAKAAFRALFRDQQR